MAEFWMWIAGIGGIIVLWQGFLLYRNRHLIKPTAMLMAQKAGIDPMTVYKGLAPLTNEEKQKLKRLIPFKSLRNKIKNEQK